MSIDINWQTLTGGPDGIARAETIRAFIHDRFQQVTLPRFVRSVQVHSFDFGSIPPEIELKDICDPLPDFYEEDEDCKSEIEDETNASTLPLDAPKFVKERRQREHETRAINDESTPSTQTRPPQYVDTRVPGLRTTLASGEQISSPLLSRAPTPGIPGGTSNMNYFHLPLGAGISGATTPLAAVAGAQFQSWPDHNHYTRHAHAQDITHHNATSISSLTPPSTADPGSRPPSQHQHDAGRRGSKADTDESSLQEEPARTPSPSPPPRMREKSVEDIQVVSHVRYSGDIKMSITAEILLDYPMPSFVGIPVTLNITGLTFDGVAILAYIKKRAHFCFLSPEDADALVGVESNLDSIPTDSRIGQQQSTRRPKIGGLLEQIKVESEIGQKENGKQVLKNVGKVEKFVLEQVRRIFEDEFVYPSFWTFLV
ncbi:mitochondrial distribution and morphology protein 12 [Lepidopterella palustris CBS 459.81]|uniref:Mitochondrial distribution and morphology protein 12 n=1 Tax=Lepidopterella palustris CBS 459.81 TaxID=1314670 RepID=A0A8E2JKA3_9PEZI|nr:mitochondrial distribution and morphology protein 12 [Lepidopterella palustris CBS 459.81]